MRRGLIAWKGYAPSGKGYTQQEIAEMMGVARSSVAEVLAKCRNDQMTIPTSEQFETEHASSLQSESSQTNISATSSDPADKVIDATPYLKGGALYETF